VAGRLDRRRDPEDESGHCREHEREQKDA
jgi:hypothetical protein